MTGTERFLIGILSSHISGKTVTVPEKIDQAALISLSHIHKLTPIVYSSLSKAEGVPANLLSSLKRNALMQMTAQISRSRAFLETAEKLSGAGIKYAVVKGITLRAIYPEPDLRLSSDEDILVDAGDFEKAADLLLSLGFEEKENSNEETNVRAFVKASSGLLIEVHNSLFPHTDSFNRRMAFLFEGALDRRGEITIDNCIIPTLSPTDHLLFLVLHSFKHFVYCGFGLRQISDFIVFAKKNINSTNAEYIVDSLRSVNALGFFDCILKICEEYFGVSRNELGFDSYTPSDTDPTNMITDVLSGGAYGNSSPERVHSSLITMSSAEGGKKKSAASALFPPYRVMKERYPFVAKHKILMPVGWVRRIFSRAFSKKENFSASESIEIGRRRAEMLRQYGVIK